MTSTMPDKESSRLLAAEMLAGESEEYLRRADKECLTRLYSLPEFGAAATVFTYVGVGPEPDTAPVIERALAEGKRVAVPLITGRGIMEARLIGSAEELSPGRFGLPEPPASSERAELMEGDLILLPAAAFSRKKQRLGRGGGYYDRFLADSHGIKIGMARERLLLDELPTGENDIGADILITEKGVYK